MYILIFKHLTYLLLFGRENMVFVDNDNISECSGDGSHSDCVCGNNLQMCLLPSEKHCSSSELELYILAK